MSKKNIDMLQDMIHDNIIQVDSLWDFFDLENPHEDNEFELMMYIISESIEEWSQE